jgi:hypothetical protein
MFDHLPSPDAVPVETLGLDTFETGLLAVLRHFLTAYARPESHAWQHAFTVAGERWGLTKGPQIAMGLLPVLQSLRGARRGAFDFANPLCEICRTYVTGTESAFLQMVQAMRRDQTEMARGAVLILTEGTMDAGLIQAALAFAARHPAEARETTRATEEPDPWQTSQHRHLRLVH